MEIAHVSQIRNGVWNPIIAFRLITYQSENDKMALASKLFLETPSQKQKTWAQALCTDDAEPRVSTLVDLHKCEAQPTSIGELHANACTFKTVVPRRG
jgi:hypothetical protein